MKIITFSSLKGGVGKSSIAIFTANFLKASGYKVLIMDFDIQNSVSFYYGIEYELTEKHNTARALNDKNLTDNIIKANDFFYPDIIPSNLELLNLQSVNQYQLDSIKNQLQDYDYIIIDTSPTFNSLILNSIIASDLIITPVNLTLFDFKTALFYENRLKEYRTGKLDNWKLLFNRYKEPKTDNPDTELNTYISLFESEFNNILNTKIIETALVRKAIDTKTKITLSKTKEKLYLAIQELCNEITNTEINNQSGGF